MVRLLLLLLPLLHWALILTGPQLLLAQAETGPQTAADNAASHYLNAFELLQYPDSPEVQKRLEKFLRDGWTADDPELERVLQKNDPALIEYQKVIELPHCDFDLGKKPRYLMDQKTPDLKSTRRLVNLILLKSRLDERLGNLGGAVRARLSLLTTSRHFAQTPSLVTKMIAVAIERTAYQQIEGDLSNNDLAQGLTSEIAQALKAHGERHFPASQLVEDERALFSSVVEKVVDQSRLSTTGLPPLSKYYVDRHASLLKDEIRRQARALADASFGNFIIAVTTNRDMDWASAERAWEELVKETRTDLWKTFQESWEVGWDWALGRHGKLEEKIARKVALLSLVISFPNWRRAAQEYHDTMQKLRELSSLAQALSQQEVGR